MRIKLTAFLVVVLLVGAQAAIAGPIIDSGTPIPDSEVIRNFHCEGLDWVYAGPASPGFGGPGEIETPDYRAGEGWRYATAAEWAGKPLWQDFTRPGSPVPVPNFLNDHTDYRFTSEYWSNYSWVDLGDADGGFITNGLDIPLPPPNAYETWYVRNTGTPCPVPLPSAVWASLALLGGLGGLRFLRRRRD